MRILCLMSLLCFILELERAKAPNLHQITGDVGRGSLSAFQLLDPLGVFSRTAVCALGFWIRFQRKMRIFAVIWQQLLGLAGWLGLFVAGSCDRAPVF